MISPLLTDLYQLTMAYGYWKLQLHEREAVFHLIFRKLPFKSNYTVVCGLGSVVEFLKNWRFSKEDIQFLKGLSDPSGSPLFCQEFLNYLATLKFTCDLDAMLEGTVVFPNEPLLRIKGPLIQGQLLESALLNMVNFQTLIATKAARVCQAAGDDPVYEFGLRRSQGPDGALSASRAAFIGGCVATSNVLAGQKYKIPLSGTHAHSWVTAFASEAEAFQSYANVMPTNCSLLVDTYDTEQGIKNAIETGKQLRMRGYDLRGIRLDSGDLAALSISARQLLDEAGFANTKIIASNSLDEYVIESLKKQGAKISIWGVGTNLMTAYDHPALDGVYKLSALKNSAGKWEYRIKLSEQPVKTSNPGIHQVRRFYQNDACVMDVIYDEGLGVEETPELISLDAPHTSIKLAAFDYSQDLLQPIFREGNLSYTLPQTFQVRQYAQTQIKQFILTHDNSPYLVGLEKNLHLLKQQLKSKLKEK